MNLVRAAAVTAVIAGVAPPVRGQPPPLVIMNASVIDASGRSPRRGQSIVIQNGRIAAVGPAGSVALPRDARRVDADGRFVIPGLWDMHVHLDVPAGREVLAAYVANGVTGVRDMGGNWDTLRSWRRDIAEGRLVGPRIVASGPYLEGNPQPIPHIRIQTADEARRGVDSLARLGVNFVKVHTGITREMFFAIATRAREAGIPFAGHVPRVVGAADASEAGQRSIEHLLTVPTPCSPSDSVRLLPRYAVQRVLGPCSSAPLDSLFAAFVRNRTWVTPTYVATVEVAGWPRRAVPGDAYARFLPDTLKRFVAAIFPMPDSVPPDADVVGRDMLSRRVALAGAMRRAGVRLLAGTDAPLRNSPPGFGLAEELRMLAEGGVSLFDLLVVATREPAEALSRREHAGLIAPGHAADLVVLESDPLLDVGAYRRVWAVVTDGRLVDTASRRALLERLERAATLRARR